MAETQIGWLQAICEGLSIESGRATIDQVFASSEILDAMLDPILKNVDTECQSCKEVQFGSFPRNLLLSSAYPAEGSDGHTTTISRKSGIGDFHETWKQLTVYLREGINRRVAATKHRSRSRSTPPWRQNQGHEQARTQNNDDSWGQGSHSWNPSNWNGSKKWQVKQTSWNSGNVDSWERWEGGSHGQRSTGWSQPASSRSNADYRRHDQEGSHSQTRDWPQYDRQNLRNRPPAGPKNGEGKTSKSSHDSWQ